MTCSESKEPKGSERSSIELSAPGFEAYYPKPPSARPFAHSCGQIPHAMDCVTGAEPVTEKPECEGGCRVYSAPPCRDPAKCSCGGEWWKHGCKHNLPPEPRCEGCGHPEHSGVCRELEMPGSPGDVDECGCLDDREPPLTPEEEEEAALGPAADDADWNSSEDAAYDTPPQPDRRPPYLLAYSVQGHLYEVALPGDATVATLDGRLVITHSLGPVAGICQIAPITSEESVR